MRYFYKTLSFFLPCLLVMGFFVFSSFSKEENYEIKNQRFLDYAGDLQKRLQDLDASAERFKLKQIGVDSVREDVRQARLAYKKIEFYLSFYHQEYTNKHLNGAPLLKISKSGMLPDVVPPEGLQVLDELVYAENAEEEANLISTVARKLHNYYEMLYAGLQSKNVNPENEFAAMRLGLVRVFTLGVTGFDTPGSLNVLQETSASLKGMYFFLKDAQKKRPSAKLDEILKLYEEAIDFLAQSDNFESFDRLVFLKQYIDPLYKKLGELTQDDQAAFVAPISSWNPESISIFAEDFLNPYFFTELQKKENSPTLTKLGEKIFYDSALSENKTMSCATCHQPSKAFTDALPKSQSNIDGKTVLRNSPTLFNAVYADRYFYDLRAFTLEQQAEHVIFNSDEFNTAYEAILKKLESQPAYVKLFEASFGKNKINRENFSKALSAYVLSLTSFDSEFDAYILGEQSDVNTEIKNGFNLFMGKAACATCHFPPTFSGLVPPFYSESESEILGVFKDPKQKQPVVDEDLGRYASQVMNEKAWIYEKSFKTTTVRNAALTAPYFHNGAYQSLEEVIDFYNNGGGEGVGLKVANQTLAPDALELTEKEKKDIITFIKALSGREALHLSQQNPEK